MTLKYFLCWCKFKKIKNYEDLRYSLEHFPYRHITIEQGKSIRKGRLRNKNNTQDYEIYVDAKSLSGHIMTIESAKTKNKVCSVHHLSIHSDFRGKKLGKPCIEGFIKLVKYEKSIEKIKFEERLWKQKHYQTFFNETLNTKLVNNKPDIWELMIE
ncbi:hypothetical protein ACT0L1_004242 [Vibrio vulnificus]|uniref:hypothetical protein n=1 Tax=Vibrio TaxID=662 RepID=UPI00235829AC|nr:hypothetical protein [Vibrio sp. CCUG 15886]MDC8111440.1 hypothetical protein [Vibrio sp. CCUG 15886]